MPYITNIVDNKDNISFDLNNSENDINISLANAIRRTVISDIETYAIDEKSVIFYNNNSILDNEFLKHRLTLIPIISDIKNLDYENLIFSCKENNYLENIKSIYANNFVCKNGKTDEIIDNNKLFKYPDILFAKLKNNQELSFEAKLIKNNSNYGGSYFSPVSACIYTFKVDETKKNEKKQDFHDDERNYELNKNDNPLTYKFLITSIGFYDSKDIVIMGIDLLKKRLSDAKEEFKNEKSKKIQLIEDSENQDFFNFIIDNENETLGNLLSTYLTYDKNTFYCGYVIEHPLNNNISFKIKLKENNNLENILLLINEKIDYIINLLNIIGSEFS